MSDKGDKIKNLQNLLNKQNLFGKPQEKKVPEENIEEEVIEHKPVKYAKPSFLDELKEKLETKNQNKN